MGWKGIPTSTHKSQTKHATYQEVSIKIENGHFWEVGLLLKMQGVNLLSVETKTTLTNPEPKTTTKGRFRKNLTEQNNVQFLSDICMIFIWAPHCWGRHRYFKYEEKFHGHLKNLLCMVKNFYCRGYGSWNISEQCLH